MAGRIGIALGDVSGIGPEVTLKALAAQRGETQNYLLIGDVGWLQRLNEHLKLYLPLTVSTGQYQVFNPVTETLPATLPGGSPIAASAAMAYLKCGAEKCLTGELAALITAPVNKESIIRAGFSFVGQTEYLSQLAGTERTAMMLLGEDDRGRWLRVVLATTHLPLREVANHLTPAKIELAIESAARAVIDLNLPQGRIAICGLNPHAGEGGKMGSEEITLITPTVEKMRARGFNVAGPFAADALFHHVYRGDFEIVVAMYHDQGLAPLKMIAFESGVNWTLGLPFIRTSPDHGTAYDIAGRGIANPSSMRAAIKLARQLAEKKKPNSTAT